LVVGDETSKQFPVELATFRTRQDDGMKVNLLVNYGWEWDLDGLKEGRLRSADIFVLDALWLDFAAQHLDTALAWFGQQDRTLGG
jgi:undecaprenyl diphosphate synthase